MEHAEALLHGQRVPRRPVPAQQAIVVRRAVVVRHVQIPRQALLRLRAHIRPHTLCALQSG